MRELANAYFQPGGLQGQIPQSGRPSWNLPLSYYIPYCKRPFPAWGPPGPDSPSWAPPLEPATFLIHSLPQTTISGLWGLQGQILQSGPPLWNLPLSGYTRYCKRPFWPGSSRTRLLYLGAPPGSHHFPNTFLTTNAHFRPGGLKGQILHSGSPLELETRLRSFSLMRLLLFIPRVCIPALVYLIPFGGGSGAKG